MKEVWTPLKWLGVRYFKDSDSQVYYKKMGNGHRRETRPFWRYKRFHGASALILLLIPGYMGYQVLMDEASEKLVSEMAGQVTKEEMNALLKDPTVQEMMEKELGTKKAEDLLKEYKIEASGIATTGISDEDLTFKKSETSNQANKEQAANLPSNAKTEQPASTESVPASANQEQAEEKEQLQPKKPMFESRTEATKFVMSKFSMSEISSFAQMAQGGLTTEEKAEIKSIVQSRLSTEEYEALKIFGLIELSKQQ
jgi:hypothetical protein